MTAVRAMLFDLDGTLVDSAPQLVEALNHVRDSIGLAPLSVEKAGHAVTRGVPGLLKAGMPEADEETLLSWRHELLGYYTKHTLDRSKLYDGVEVVLAALGAAGIPCGIVTNRSESLTRPLVEVLGLAEQMACMVCSDTLGVSKPHPAPVLFACKRLGVEPGDTLFVGDDPRDIEAGAAAGTRTAAVFYGYGSGALKGPLVEESVPVHHPKDLLFIVP